MSRRAALAETAKQFNDAYNPTAAAAAVSNAVHESRGDANNRHFDQPRFRGTEAENAHGLFQFGGTEWNEYSKWLSKNHPGKSWQDPKLQNAFLINRLKTDPQYKGLNQILQNLKPGQEAYGAMMFQKLYERPKVIQQSRGATGNRLGPQIQQLIEEGRSGDGIKGLSDDIRKRMQDENPGPKNMLKSSLSSGVLTGYAQKIEGDATVRIALGDQPRSSGPDSTTMFRNVSYNRGRTMTIADENG